MPTDHDKTKDRINRVLMGDTTNPMQNLDPGTAVVLIDHYRRKAVDFDLQPFEQARYDMAVRIVNAVARLRMTQIAWPAECADASDQ